MSEMIKKEDLVRHVYISRAPLNRKKYAVMGVAALMGKAYDTREEAVKVLQAEVERILMGDHRFDSGTRCYVYTGKSEDGGQVEADEKAEMILESVKQVQEYLMGKGMDEADSQRAAQEKVSEFLSSTNYGYKNPDTVADRVVQMMEGTVEPTVEETVDDTVEETVEDPDSR